MKFAKSSPRPAEQKQFDHLLWGRAEIPTFESGNFAAIGATGSGKSTLLRLFLQSAFFSIGVVADHRALVYDAKQDALPMLAAIAPQAKILTSHPFDARGARWDMAADIQEATVAIEFAFTLIPTEGDAQPFFVNAARHLMYGVIVSFILTGEPWTFGTLVRALKHPKRIRSILRRHPQTREIISQYFYDERLLMNIMSTLATKMLPFEPIAAAWDAATESFSLREWVTGNWILVLGNYETGRTAIDAINRCIFKRACDLTLNLPNSNDRRSWFIVDELSEASGSGGQGGGLPGIVSLAKKGRSRGAVLAIAFQSISGLRDPKVYGQYFTDEILGQIANRFFGRIECVATAEWASSLFGDEESERETVTQSHGPGGASQSVSRQATARRLVMPSELMSIEACTRENGLSGYYIVRSEGAYFDKIPGEELFGGQLIPPRDDVAEFLPRPATDQFLAPWTPIEQVRFGAPKRKRASQDLPTPITENRRQSASPEVWGDLDQAFE